MSAIESLKPSGYLLHGNDQVVSMYLSPEADVSTWRARGVVVEALYSETRLAEIEIALDEIEKTLVRHFIDRNAHGGALAWRVFGPPAAAISISRHATRLEAVRAALALDAAYVAVA